MNTSKRTGNLSQAKPGTRMRGRLGTPPGIHFESPLERDAAFVLLIDFRTVKARDPPVTTKRAGDTAS
ncbi:hypothetical protein [Microvirga sp. P5_D2]|jgi:hypothetical protein